MYLDPAEANIQLDVEKLDISSPDLAPSAVTPENYAAGHLSRTEDVEMREIPSLQDKNVGHLIVLRDQTDANLSNLDP